MILVVGIIVNLSAFRFGQHIVEVSVLYLEHKKTKIPSSILESVEQDERTTVLAPTVVPKPVTWQKIGIFLLLFLYFLLLFFFYLLLFYLFIFYFLFLFIYFLLFFIFYYLLLFIIFYFLLFFIFYYFLFFIIFLINFIQIIFF